MKNKKVAIVLIIFLVVISVAGIVLFNMSNNKKDAELKKETNKLLEGKSNKSLTSKKKNNYSYAENDSLTEEEVLQQEIDKYNESEHYDSTVYENEEICNTITTDELNIVKETIKQRFGDNIKVIFKNCYPDTDENSERVVSVQFIVDCGDGSGGTFWYTGNIVDANCIYY